MATEYAAIGVDIGGSSTKLGIVTRQGEILCRAERVTPQEQPTGQIVSGILEELTGLVQWAGVSSLPLLGIGVSVCGYLAPSGEAPDYINLHALDGYPIAQRFREACGLPVVMDNDMNCGVLGEYLFGEARAEKRLMSMTVATGIGMGVVLDGVVFRGSAGAAGNPGHIILQPDGPVCVAGCRGCLESLASAGPIARRAEDMALAQRPTLLSEMLAAKGHLTTVDLFQAAEAGDLVAQEIWEEAGRWLGRGLASWVEIFTPHVVVLGGGVAQAGHWLLDPLEREMRRVGEPYFTRRVRSVRLSVLGREAAVLGAAALFLYPEHAPAWSSRGLRQ